MTVISTSFKSHGGEKSITNGNNLINPFRNLRTRIQNSICKKQRILLIL